MCLSLVGTRVQSHFLHGIGEAGIRAGTGLVCHLGHAKPALGRVGSGGRVPPAASPPTAPPPSLGVEGPEPGRGIYRTWSRNSTRASWRRRTGAGTCTGRPSCTDPAASACTPPPSPRGRAGAGRASLATPEPLAGVARLATAWAPSPLEGTPPGLRPQLPSFVPAPGRWWRLERGPEATRRTAVVSTDS